MHFGIVSPPVPGHLNPFSALGRELTARGHRVTLFHVPDLADRAQADGLEFVPIGEASHPIGFLPESLRRLSQLEGLSAIRFTLQEACGTTEMMLRDAPEQMRRAGIGALLCDQTEPAGGTLADHLGIPYVTVCNALALNRESHVPPPFTPWTPLRGPIGQIRNSIGYSMSETMLKGLRVIVAKQRSAWSLRPYRSVDETFSSLLQISQQVAGFDYPRRKLPSSFHYTGPLRRSAPQLSPFPWERLDGRPVVYASLGTLQTSKAEMFRTIAAACASLPVQLVLTHGGGLDQSVTDTFAGDPVVVSYAPQVEVLKRAALTVTHAGLNTALDSLSCGVPMVAVPITFEQPAIASRIKWSGSGEVIALKQLSVPKLRAAVEQVLGDSRYRNRAGAIAAEIRGAGGTVGAADLIEQALSLR